MLLRWRGDNTETFITMRSLRQTFLLLRLALVVLLLLETRQQAQSFVGVSAFVTTRKSSPFYAPRLTNSQQAVYEMINNNSVRAQSVPVRSKRFRKLLLSSLSDTPIDDNSEIDSSDNESNHDVRDQHDDQENNNAISDKDNNSVADKVQAFSDVGDYDPAEKLPGERKQVNVGDPQIKVKDKEKSVTAILKELAAIQQQGPQKYCILGTRHCSYLHQQIIELLAYALVLSGNHVYTSGAGGTHAATIRGALRAANEELLTVVIPQSLSKQPKESQELLAKVKNLETMPQNDEMSLDIASRICNSYLLSQADQLISFAFHESSTVIEASKEAKKLDMLVTTLYLD